MGKRVFLFVLDSFGIGNAPDAEAFGDAGTNTILACSKSQYFDLKVVVDEESILAVIRDDGQRFDPVHAENMGTGLKIVKSMCKDIDYTYVYGLNMVFLKWMR